MAKCYFAKHKLVWEVLDGCLKNKIEIPWSDIMALKANYPEDGPGSLEVVVTIIDLLYFILIGMLIRFGITIICGTKLVFLLFVVAGKKTPLF